MNNIIRDKSYRDKVSFTGDNSYLIGVSGKKKSGKDTFFELFSRYASQKNINFENRKFAKKVKEICSMLTGMDIEYFMDRQFYNEKVNGFDMTSRQLQQLIGTEVFRNNFDTDVWVKSLFNSYRANNNWIITDVRFPNEADHILNRGGKVIRINRPDVDDGDTHLSETALDEYDRFTYIIDNNDTYDVYKSKIINVANKIIR
jgi:hypothetical protein